MRISDWSSDVCSSDLVITPRGDGGVQIGKRFAVVEPGNLWHHAVEQVEATIRLRDEGDQAFMPIHATLRRILVEQIRGACAGLLRRQAQQRQVIDRKSGV